MATSTQYIWSLIILVLALGYPAGSLGDPGATTPTRDDVQERSQGHENTHSPHKEYKSKRRRKVETWGKEVDHIQTAIGAMRGAAEGVIVFWFHARNTSDQKIVMDAKPPATNNSRLLLRRPNDEVITTGGGWAMRMFPFLLPPHWVLSWQERLPNSGWIPHMLKEADGRYMLSWELGEAESPPLYLRVEGDQVIVYKDRWETVDFTFRLQAGEDNPSAGSSPAEESAGGLS